VPASAVVFDPRTLEDLTPPSHVLLFCIPVISYQLDLSSRIVPWTRNMTISSWAECLSVPLWAAKHAEKIGKDREYIQLCMTVRTQATCSLQINQIKRPIRDQIV
jgi:hypothetical protein